MKIKPFWRKHKTNKSIVTSADEIARLFIVPVMQLGVDHSSRREPAENLRGLFGVDDVTIDLLMPTKSIELIGDLVSAPWRRIPGIRGIVAAPGTEAWVREDHVHKLVDVELPGSPHHDGVWVSMPSEMFDLVRRHFVKWDRIQSKKIRIRHRDAVRQAGLRRQRVHARLEFPCS